MSLIELFPQEKRQTPTVGYPRYVLSGDAGAIPAKALEPIAETLAGKMLIKPSKAAVKRFLEDIRELIKARATDKTAQLIQQLNLKLSGWANYYRHVVAKGTFAYVDTQVFPALCTWIKQRHPHKSVLWKKDTSDCGNGCSSREFGTRSDG